MGTIISMKQNIIVHATQGYRAEDMDHTRGSKFYDWFKKSDLAHMFLLLVLSLIIEIAIFNHGALDLLLSQGYQRVNLDLGVSGKLINGKEGNAIVLENLKVKAKNLYVELKSEQEQLVLVKLEFADQGSRFALLPNATHKISTIAPYNDTYFHFNLTGEQEELYALRLSFLGENTTPIYVSKLVFNAYEPINISKVRLVIIFALLVSAYLLYRLQGYRLSYDNSIKTQAFLMALPLLLAIGYSLSLYYLDITGVQSFSSKEQQTLMVWVVNAKLVLAIFTLLSLYGAFKSLLCYFELKVNALLLFLCYAVILGASQVFYIQMDVLKESFSPLIIVLLLSSALSAAYGLATYERYGQSKAIILIEYVFILILSIVLLSLVRPLALILLLSLCAPLWLLPLYKIVTKQAILKLKAPKKLTLSNSRLLLGEMIFLKIPGLLLVSSLLMCLIAVIGEFNLLPKFLVLLGAEPFIGLMQTNYETYSVFNIELLANAWYYYFVEPINYFKTFPLVVPNIDNAPLGVAVVLQERVSVMAMPFTLSLALMFFKSTRKAIGQELKVMISSTIIGSLVFAYGSFYCYGAGVSLVMPVMVALLMCASLLVLVLFTQPSGMYAIVCALALKSIIVSLLLPFAYQGTGLPGQFIVNTNVDAILYLEYLFNSVGF